MTKYCTTNDKILHNICEILKQRMTHIAQHMMTNYTTYDRKLVIILQNKTLVVE